MKILFKYIFVVIINYAFFLSITNAKDLDDKNLFPFLIDTSILSILDLSSVPHKTDQIVLTCCGDNPSGTSFELIESQSDHLPYDDESSRTRSRLFFFADLIARLDELRRIRKEMSSAENDLEHHRRHYNQLYLFSGYRENEETLRIYENLRETYGEVEYEIDDNFHRTVEDAFQRTVEDALQRGGYPVQLGNYRLRLLGNVWAINRAQDFYNLMLERDLINADTFVDYLHLLRENYGSVEQAQRALTDARNYFNRHNTYFITNFNTGLCERWLELQDIIYGYYLDILARHGRLNLALPPIYTRTLPTHNLHLGFGSIIDFSRFTFGFALTILHGLFSLETIPAGDTYTFFIGATDGEENAARRAMELFAQAVPSIEMVRVTANELGVTITLQLNGKYDPNILLNTRFRYHREPDLGPKENSHWDIDNGEEISTYYL